MFKSVAKFLFRKWWLRTLTCLTRDIDWSQIEQIKEIVKEIDGCPDSHGILLYTLARSGSGAGTIVEIGSFKGKSTIWLASGSKSAARERIYAIDPHTGSEEHREKLGNEINTEPEFRYNIERTGVKDWVSPLVMKSAEAVVGWKEPVRLLWIDGSHEYEDVRSDFLSWEPHLVCNGIIAFHDCFGFAGPRRVVKELLLTSDKFSNIGFIGGLVFAKKVDKISVAERLSKLLTSIYILVIAFVVEHIPRRVAGFISRKIY